MTGSERRAPFAAYLYLLNLDPPDLGWEYLRRRPDYRQFWRERGAAARFGLYFH
jgi:Proteobacterial transcriptional regulator-like domain